MAEYRTEEEQIELLKNWWKESGTSTVVGVVIALSGWLCWTAWQNYNVTQVEVAAGLYQELSVGQEGDASADLVKEKELTSKLIESHSDSVYMVFANLQLAKSFMDSGDLKEANASLLLAKATADSLDSELSTLISIRLARVQIAQADYAAALATVNAIKNSGIIAGYPMINFKATLLDGSYHDVDSSVLAFEIAAKAAFREGMPLAGPKLLEPIMKVEVVTPEEYMGDIIGDLNSRRGQVTSMDNRGNAKVISANVPLAEMFGYVNTLRSQSQGRASFSMDLDSYAQVPQHVVDAILLKQQGKNKP